MANNDAVTAAKRGRRAFREWHMSHHGQVDLSRADLRNVDLRWINFAGANLEGVNFAGARLTGCYFGPSKFHAKAPFVTLADIPVNLEGVIFEDAVLLAATFNYPELYGADFSGAYLGMANFRNVDFVDVSFQESRLVNTSFNSCNLTDAIGLDSILHYGPSHIDVETLYRSSSLAPWFFLQAGVPSHLMDNLEDIISSSGMSGFYSCFLSHATEDREFCDRLHNRLTLEGLRVWYAPKDMRGGEKILPQLSKAIRIHDKVIVVLSPSSMQSPWVGNELRWAHRREALCGSMTFFPISLVPFSTVQDWEFVDPDSGVDIAAEIRQYYIPDFSEWEDDARFESTFQRLLRDLRQAASEIPESEEMDIDRS